MPAVQRMGTDADGRPVVVKVAAPGPDAEALAREAAVLRGAAHPGVVEVADDGPTADGGYRLTTRLAGTRTLASLHPRVEEAAGIVAALATTLADLHGVGIVHGAIEPDHVVLDDRGAPVLCGFGPGCRGELGSAADDVAGLGEVLAALVGEAADVEPIPERRFGRRPAWVGGIARRSLLNLADQARADDPSLRPPARSFAAAVLSAVPAARLAGMAPVLTPSGGDGDGDDRPRVSVLRLAGAVAGLAFVIYGVSAVVGSPGGPAPAELADRAVPTTVLAPGTAPTTAVPVQACDGAVGTVADPDGDGCPSPVRIAGGVVEVDGVRYAVGAAGDVLAVGDWDCDGGATVAALRPATGEVFVFTGWAAPGDDLVVTAAGHVSGADQLVADDPDGDGCPALVAVAATGERTEVPT